MWAIFYSEAIPFNLELNVRRGSRSTAIIESAATPGYQEPVEIDKSGQEHPVPYRSDGMGEEDLANLQELETEDHYGSPQVTNIRPGRKNLLPEQPDRERPDMDRDMSDWLDPYNTPEEESRLPDRYGWDQYDTGYYY